jgi:L-fuculose-phosphate aldolase
MDVARLYKGCEPQREELAYFMRRLYEKGLTTCSGGNVSMRLESGHVIVTASGVDKGRISASEVALLTLAGENLTPNLTATSETEMHLAVLRARPDVKAVVHAHPLAVTSFSCTDDEIEYRLVGETYVVLGVPATARFIMGGTTELAAEVAGKAADADVIIMKNHGALTVGPTLLKAFDRIEVLEAAAQMTALIRLVSKPVILKPADLAALEARFGLRKKFST